VLIVIYILNYVGVLIAMPVVTLYSRWIRLTEITPGVCKLSISIIPYLLILCSAARLRGFEQELHLVGLQFATLLSILYVGYILMQIPSWVQFKSP
jgi:hypothetical protein